MFAVNLGTLAAVIKRAVTVLTRVMVASALAVCPTRSMTGLNCHLGHMSVQMKPP